MGEVGFWATKVAMFLEGQKNCLHYMHDPPPRLAITGDETKAHPTQ